METNRIISYVTRAKYETIKDEIRYMETEGGELLAKLLASSPSSGMGRPHDLPAHQIAAEFRGHLLTLKNILNTAVIIDDLRSGNQDRSSVAIGFTVVILFIGESEPVEYTILGQQEADPEEGIISCFSPIGSSLLGKKKGETISVKLGNNPSAVEIQILDITQKSLDFEYPPTIWKSTLESLINI